MTIDPFAGDVIKLEGSSHRYRRRVANYRIFFALDVKARTVEVSAIVRRTTTAY
jgi:mRNA-degrading endonuclease RelE of RelBE toxin-antitoxin system